MRQELIDEECGATRCHMQHSPDGMVEFSRDIEASSGIAVLPSPTVAYWISWRALYPHKHKVASIFFPQIY